MEYKLTDDHGVERRYRPGDSARFADLRQGDYFFEGDQLWCKGFDSGTAAVRAWPRVDLGSDANYGVFLPSTIVHRAVTVATAWEVLEKDLQYVTWLIEDLGVLLDDEAFAEYQRRLNNGS